MYKVASLRWKLLTTNKLLITKTAQKTPILNKTLYSSPSCCGLNPLLQYSYRIRYLWRPQGRSSGQRWAEEGLHGADLPRVWTGNWKLQTTGIGVWTWRSLWWSRHSWHTENMTSTFSQIWNTIGLALDIATSSFQFNPMEHKQFCHFSLRIRAEIWKRFVLIMLYSLSNNPHPLSLSFSLSLYHYLSLSLSDLAWRLCCVAGLKLRINQTLVK